MTICDMGMQRLYNESGGFSEYLYHQVGETIVASNGVECKIVEKIDKASYDGLPILSNTSEVYFKTDANGEIIQARIYKDRKPVCDFDWNHNHTNKNGEKFKEGTVHVQPFKKDAMDSYGMRDEQEKCFQLQKGPLNQDRTRCWTESSKHGRMLICFIGLILTSYVRHVWESTPICGGSSAPLNQS